MTAEDSSRADLRADCESCAALCCVAPRFEVSADFPIHKPAGEACPNLTSDYRCGIHDDLRQKGFLGCAAFDCFGAGPRTTRAFGARTWRTNPAIAQPMFRSFGVLRLLHEILWYLEEASDRFPEGAMRDEVRRLRLRTQNAARSEPPSPPAPRCRGAAERRRGTARTSQSGPAWPSSSRALSPRGGPGRSRVRGGRPAPVRPKGGLPHPGQPPGR